MALQKQKFQLSIVDGLDTKTDQKNVVATKFLELENVVHTKTGSLSKSEGYTSYPLTVFNNPNKIVSGSSLSSFKNEVLLYGQNETYSFSKTENAWLDKGFSQQVITSEDAIYSNNSALRRPSMVFGYNYILYTVDQELNNNPVQINYRLVDTQTGNEITRGSVNGGYGTPVFLDGLFYIYFYNYTTSAVNLVIINPATLSVTLSAATVVAVYPQSICAKVVGDRIFLTYVLTSNANLNILFRNSDGSSSAAITINADSGTPLFVNINSEGTNNVRVVWSRDVASYGLKTVAYNYDLNTALHSTAQINTTATGGAMASNDRVSKCYGVGFSTYSELYWSYRSGTVAIDTLKAQITTTGTVSGLQAIMYNTVQLVEPILYNGMVYMTLAKAYPISVNSHNRSAFVVTGTGSILARVFQEATVVDEYAYNNTTIFNRVLGSGPRAAVINGKLLIPLPVLDAVSTTGAAQFNDLTRVSQATLDFSATLNYFDAELGGNLHTSGNILRAYDGQAVVEHGFLDAPATVSVSSTSSFGPPFIPAGTYQWTAVYSWKDAQGNLHRSKPAIPSSLTLDGTTSVNVAVPCTPFTSKSNVAIEVYRFSATQSNFHRLVDTGGGYSTISNVPRTPTQIYIDNLSDANIAGNELLYTEGNVLENASAQASKMAILWRNRIVLLGSDGRSIQVSKLRGLNEPVEFADELVYPLDEVGGIGTAIEVLDDNLVIFKERAIQYMSGQGPDNTGANDDFGRPSLITAEAGVLDPASVVRMPMGLMFKSEKGIYLLSRGQGVTYIGAPVEAYNGLTVSSSVLRTDTNEVRFTTLGGTTLIYDYYHGRWSTLNYQAALDSMALNSKVYYVRTSGLVLEQDSSFANDGSPINSKIVTAWLSLGGLQGFQRFFRLLILGNFKDKHKLRIRFAYDFNDAYVQEELVDATSVLSTVAYGDGQYGNAVYGGEFPLYQFDIRPKIQKCQAFKLCIEDVSPSGGSEGFTLSNIAAELGIENGLNRIKASRKFGAS